MIKYHEILNYRTVLLMIFTVKNIGMAIEEPKYTLVKSDGKIEIREYQSYLVAETFISGSKMNEASNAGFRKLFKYISGNNRTNTDIAMTAPVTQLRSGNAWTVSFIMPESWTMETLPIPNDPRVKLQPIPARRVLAITFSGTASDEAIGKRTDELRRYARDHKLTTIGEPVLAFYNPPWTLPWFRRNEVMLELAR